VLSRRLTYDCLRASGAPTLGTIEFAAIRAQALEGRVTGTSQMVAPAAEKSSVVAAGQSDHGAEVLAFRTVGATHR